MYGPYRNLCACIILFMLEHTCKLIRLFIAWKQCIAESHKNMYRSHLNNKNNDIKKKTLGRFLGRVILHFNDTSISQCNAVFFFFIIFILSYNFRPQNQKKNEIMKKKNIRNINFFFFSYFAFSLHFILHFYL